MSFSRRLSQPYMPKSFEKQEEELTPVESTRRGSVTDAVFGEITEGGPNYRNVHISIYGGSK